MTALGQWLSLAVTMLHFPVSFKHFQRLVGTIHYPHSLSKISLAVLIAANTKCKCQDRTGLCLPQLCCWASGVQSKGHKRNNHTGWVSRALKSDSIQGSCPILICYLLHGNPKILTTNHRGLSSLYSRIK